MNWLLNFLNWFYSSLSANLPSEIFVFLFGVLIFMWRDRRRYRRAMEKLLLLEHQSLILIEQVVIKIVNGKLVLFFRDLPGMTYVEKLFNQQELITFLQKAAENRTLANPVLELDDEGWPGALKLLFSHVRSACATLCGYKRQEYFLVPTCWKRGGDVSAIRVFVIPKAIFRALAIDKDNWWSKLEVEEPHHATRLIALRQAARQYFGIEPTRGPGIDIVIAQIAAPTDWNANIKKLKPIDWSKWQRQLKEVGLKL